MVVTVQHWGNSLALRLPKAVAKQVRVKKGSRLDLSVNDNKIVLVNEESPSYSLKGLLSELKPGQQHHEIETGKPQGKEVW